MMDYSLSEACANQFLDATRQTARRRKLLEAVLTKL